MKRHLGQHFKRLLLLTMLLLASGAITTTVAQSTSFTYQGRLQDGGTNANGSYDFQFTVWDAFSGGNQQPQPSPVTVTKTSVAVANGTFTVQLDFGASAFPGANRFLEISTRLAGGGAFTILSPRQPVTSTPYAIRSLSAASVDSVPVSAVPPGSGNYIQNANSPAQPANFNISGSGTVGGSLTASTVNATSQFTLNAQPVLKLGPGLDNFFVGIGAGSPSTTGSVNSFFGSNAGHNNSSGDGNAFFGNSAGTVNSTGSSNAFFGGQAGFSNTTGSGNSFFGNSAGTLNRDADNNSFFGHYAGNSNVSGINNAFFGRLAGSSNTDSYNSFFGSQAGLQNSKGQLNSFFGYNTGFANQTGVSNAFFGATAGNNNQSDDNSFFGFQAGVNSSTGQLNSFFGAGAGVKNTTGSNNTLIGAVADLSSNNLTNATAVGANAFVGQSNSLILGSINLINGATADTSVGIGTTAPIQRLHVVGNGLFTGSLGIGASSPAVALEVQRNSTVASDWETGQLRISGASDPNMQLSLGYDTSSNLGVIQAGQAGVAFKNLSLNPSGGNVGIGTAAPQSKLHVNGVIRMDALGSPAGVFPLCWNVNDQIASCTSSSLRYKAEVKSFSGGLEIISRLRPISFTWRDGGIHDVGLAAEEVEKVEPLLAYRNKKGEVEGVRYNQLSAVFINAFKEQQAQISQQKEQLKQQKEQIKRQQDQAKQQRAELRAQQQQLEELKKLVCRSHRRANVCK